MRLYLAGCVTAAALASTSATAAETIRYVYDARGRLIKVERFVASNPTVTSDYEYDRADNRKRVKVTGSTNAQP